MAHGIAQVENHPARTPLLSTRWPVFTAELAAALTAEGEIRLAEQVGRLRVHDEIRYVEVLYRSPLC